MFTEVLLGKKKNGEKEPSEFFEAMYTTRGIILFQKFQNSWLKQKDASLNHRLSRKIYLLLLTFGSEVPSSWITESLPGQVISLAKWVGLHSDWKMTEIELDDLLTVK